MQLHFPPFVLDQAAGQLRRGQQRIALRPKTYAVLVRFLTQPGRLLSRQDLLDAVWPGTAVNEEVLGASIREIRRALGDDPRAPRYLETVHGRGYRFLVDVSPRTVEVPAQSAEAPTRPNSAVCLIGREPELAQLDRCFANASAGKRQIVFVTGEVGIGKTLLVETFLDTLATHAQPGSPLSLLIGRGQCIDQFSAGESFMPLLEALARLCRQPSGHVVTAALRQYAPAWLLQLPGALGPTERDELAASAALVGPERMLRTLAEALEALSNEGPLILVIEDLHCSDPATIDLIARLAYRREPARLMVLGTFRPIDLIMREHVLRPLVRELSRHDLCEEIALEFLDRPAVATYLERRLGIDAPSAKFVDWVHARSHGRPLFMVSIVDHLIRRQVIERRGDRWHVQSDYDRSDLPEGIRDLIVSQLEQLPLPDQQILEGGSAVGLAFPVAAAAAAVLEDAHDVEARCAGISRRGEWLRPDGVEHWPDRTVSTRYRFAHPLYQEVLSARIPAGLRLQFHQRIGERLEAAYAGRGEEIAAELALHFDLGGDPSRAVEYYRQAAVRAAGRAAHQVVISHLERALVLLEQLPDGADRTFREIVLLLAHAASLIAIRGGYADPALGPTLRRARDLSGKLGDTPLTPLVLEGLSAFHLGRAELGAALENANQSLAHAQAMALPEIIIAQAMTAVANAQVGLGEFCAARCNYERAIEMLARDSAPSAREQSFFWVDPTVVCKTNAGAALVVLGELDTAFDSHRQALQRARELSHPFTLAFALTYGAGIHSLAENYETAGQFADEAMALSSDHGFPFWHACASVFAGCAAVAAGDHDQGLTLANDGLDRWVATGGKIVLSGALVVAVRAHLRAGDLSGARFRLWQAFAHVEDTGELYAVAEIHRLMGEVTLAAADDTDARQAAEVNFRRAIAIAEAQSARLWERPARASLRSAGS